jgi:hypothetical protein
MRERPQQKSAKIQKVKEVKKKIAPKIWKYPNVTGIGVGYKEVGGKRTEIIALRVYVKKKVPKGKLRPEEILPEIIDGVPLDVIEKHFQIHQAPIPVSEHRRFHNTMVGGISIGNIVLGGSGTLGVQVFDRNGQPLILSNWHVFCGRADCASGEPVIQPGSGGGDGGDASRIVARLHRWALTDEVDAAVAHLSGHRLCSEEILGLGRTNTYGVAEIGMRVRKSGRTTGVTYGQVDDQSADITVDYGDMGGERIFHEQIVIGGTSPISEKGDSGSVWIDDDNRIIGLLFSGSKEGDSAIANPILAVIEALDIHLIGLSLHDVTVFAGSAT